MELYFNGVLAIDTSSNCPLSTFAYSHAQWHQLGFMMQAGQSAGTTFLTEEPAAHLNALRLRS
jgi:hypothetical protein